MKSIISYLEQLNLTEIESKLFITLLESGPITVRELAELADMKRTTAYLYIDQLVEKGLVMKVVKGSHKLIAVVDPEVSIQNLVEQKIKMASSLKEEFSTILKNINETLPEGKEIGDAEIKFYKGTHGVKKVYEEALMSNEIRSFVNLSAMGQLFVDTSDLFMDAFKNNLNLKMYEIFEDSEQSRKAIESQSDNTRFFYKFHPDEMRFSAADTLIYDGKVSIVNVRANDVTGVILKNNEYYNNSKELFDYIWNILPEVEKKNR